MINDYEKAKEIVTQYKQEHLLSFYNELNNDEKKALVNQILNTDFKQIFDLYEASKKDEIIPNNEIEPLDYSIKSKLSKEKISFCEGLGKQAILSKQCGLVTLAGGQGTRLGYKGPKGTFELDIVPKKSLFEISCDNLKKIKGNFGVYVPWYIMTSSYNDIDTKNFFENNNYFNYPKEYIKFFKQHQLPLIDISGNLILEETYKIKEASNGNGDVFISMLRK